MRRLAGVLSAVWARGLSRDLLSPAWAVIGVVLLTAGVVWCTSWRSYRRVDPRLAVVSLALCAAVAWAAWVPSSLVLPQRELLGTVASHHDDATAQAADLWATLGSGRCVGASEVDLGLVGGLGAWREVCTMGDAPDHRFVTYRPLDPHLLTLVWGPASGIPGACARRIAGGWWAVADHVPGEPRRACEPGFTLLGQG